MNKPKLIEDTLRQVTSEFITMSHLLEDDAWENHGIVSDEVNELFEKARGDMMVKLGQCCVILEKFTSLRDRIRAERDRLAEHERVAENTAERIKELMLFQMDRAGVLRCDTEYQNGDIKKLWLQRSAKKVEIVNEDDVPEEYKTETVAVTMTPRDAAYLREVLRNMADEEECKDAFDVASTTRVSKTEIRNAYKAMAADGVEGEIPGTKYVDGKLQLRIK